jgi:hypothetical protein
MVGNTSAGSQNGRNDYHAESDLRGVAHARVRAVQGLDRATRISRLQVFAATVVNRRRLFFTSLISLNV